jgi:enamine deaminase RidA (YjgF/YER057c/UK114 family)
MLIVGNKVFVEGQSGIKPLGQEPVVTILPAAVRKNADRFVYCHEELYSFVHGTSLIDRRIVVFEKELVVARNRRERVSRSVELAVDMAKHTRPAGSVVETKQKLP